MAGGVVLVECGDVESRRHASLDDRAEFWGGMNWVSFGGDEESVIVGGLASAPGATEETSNGVCCPDVFLACGFSKASS